MTELLRQYTELLNKELTKFEFGKHPRELYEPIRYIMDLGGKRMRPILTLLAYNLFRDDVASILRPALAVEVFHNFTLMHDDIMDNAPLRRGQATVHEKWNSNVAILSGDTMLVKAYDLLLEVPGEKLPAIIRSFNQCAVEVCEGQQIDMNFEKMDAVTEADYIEMIRLKTAVLLGFSLELGAVLGNASAHDAQLLKGFGENIGIGFQLKDDLLDVYGDQAKFGKQVGGDIIANKKTFLLIQALRMSTGDDRRQLENWLMIKDFDTDEKVEAVKGIYDRNGIRELTDQKMNDYFDLALRQLSELSLPDSRKQTMKDFADYLIAREN
jgi:geranylgeranyl diphosphate synthase, type II